MNNIKAKKVYKKCSGCRCYKTLEEFVKYKTCSKCRTKRQARRIKQDKTITMVMDQKKMLKFARMIKYVYKQHPRKTTVCLSKYMIGRLDMLIGNGNGDICTDEIKYILQHISYDRQKISKIVNLSKGVIFFNLEWIGLIKDISSLVVEYAFDELHTCKRCNLYSDKLCKRLNMCSNCRNVVNGNLLL